MEKNSKHSADIPQNLSSRAELWGSNTSNFGRDQGNWRGYLNGKNVNATQVPHLGYTLFVATACKAGSHYVIAL